MKSAPLALLVCALLTSACTTAKTNAKPKPNGYQQTGTASWYGSENRKMASGASYHASDLTAAHRTLPLGTKVKVTNVANSKSVVVRINDRGPYARQRILDVSRAAALELQMTKAGTARVKLEVLAEN